MHDPVLRIRIQKHLVGHGQEWLFFLKSGKDRSAKPQKNPENSKDDCFFFISESPLNPASVAVSWEHGNGRRLEGGADRLTLDRAHGCFSGRSVSGLPESRKSWWYRIQNPEGVM